MEKNIISMSIFGVGPKIGRVVLPFLILSIAATLYKKEIFGFNILPYKVLAIIGAVMIITGLIINLSAAREMVKAVKNGKLLTTGLYGLCRNPMYASFVFFTIPGIAFMVNSWCILPVSIITWIAIQKIIPNEEQLLMEVFGDDYKNYCKKVARVLPIIKL